MSYSENPIPDGPERPDPQQPAPFTRPDLWEQAKKTIQPKTAYDIFRCWREYDRLLKAETEKPPRYPKCPICGSPITENPDLEEIVCGGEPDQHLFQVIYEDTDCNSILDTLGVELTGRYCLIHTLTFNRVTRELTKIGRWGERYPKDAGRYYGRSLYPRRLASDEVASDEDPTKYLLGGH